MMIMHRFDCNFSKPIVRATYTRPINWDRPEALRYDVCMACGARSTTRREAL